MDFLSFMNGGLHVRDFRPALQLAASCEHIDGEHHRFALFDTFKLVKELGGGPGVVIPIGGLRVGRFGIVFEGYAATDIWAVMRNVVWEDEHCNVCCGSLMRFNEVFDQRLLIRCGPTIGAPEDIVSVRARSIVDEYWTD